MYSKKNNKIKKLGLSLISTTMFISLFQLPTHFASAPKNEDDLNIINNNIKYIELDNIKYELDIEKEIAKIVGVKDNKIETINVPNVVEFESVEYKIKEIKEKAFFYCSNLNFISIGENIRIIKSFAFPFRENYKVHFRYKTTESKYIKIEVQKNAFLGVESIENGMEYFIERKGANGEIIYIMPTRLCEMM
ncbi:MAG: hypothetical protein J6C55_02590 [Oscillospiraceae bacterium]|nr:hypothetical protein [Oscillospiraceae bacterium]